MAGIEFKTINKPNMHGIEASVGLRHAEVVQTDSCCGSWACFTYIDGRIMRHPEPKPDTSKADALKAAKAFLARTEPTHQFYNCCDRFRAEPEGERRWHQMMANKQPVSLAHFAAVCDPSGILEEDETLAQWWEEAQREDATANLYQSYWDAEPVYFVQRAGFEFIFRPTEAIFPKSVIGYFKVDYSKHW